MKKISVLLIASTMLSGNICFAEPTISPSKKVSNTLEFQQKYKLDNRVLGRIKNYYALERENEPELLELRKARNEAAEEWEKFQKENAHLYKGDTRKEKELGEKLQEAELYLRLEESDREKARPVLTDEFKYLLPSPEARAEFFALMDAAEVKKQKKNEEKTLETTLESTKLANQNKFDDQRVKTKQPDKSQEFNPWVIVHKHAAHISPYFGTFDPKASLAKKDKQKVIAEASKDLPTLSAQVQSLLDAEEEMAKQKPSSEEEAKTMLGSFVKGTIVALNAVPQKEWEIADGVAYNIVKELGDLAKMQKSEIEKVLAEQLKETLSPKKKKEQEAGLQFVLTVMPSVKMPKTKALIATEYDFIFDIIEKLSPEYAKQIKTAFVGQNDFKNKTIEEMNTIIAKATIELEAAKANNKSTNSNIQKALEVNIADLQARQVIEAVKEARQGVEVVSNAVAPVIADTLTSVATQATASLATRMAETAAVGVGSGSEDSSIKFGPFAQVFGGIAHQAANIKNTNPYSMWSAGLLIGTDMEVSDNASLGAALIYSRANVQFYNGETLNEKANTFNNCGLSLYGQFMPTERISIDAQISGIMNNMTLEKGSKKSAKLGFGSANVKYYLPVVGMNIVPKIGISALKGSFDADTQTSDSVGKLEGDVSRFAANLGLGFQKTFQVESGLKFTPEIHLGADYMLAGNARNAEGYVSMAALFPNEADNLKKLDIADRTGLMVGLSLNVKKSEAFDVTIGADAMATATQLGTKFGIIENAAIKGDFYSASGYLKIKISL